MQQKTDDQPGDHHHGEDPMPRYDVQQLSHQNRRQCEAKERHCRLLDTQVQAMTARFRSIQCRHDTRRGVGALRCADHRANQHQAEQARSQSAETGEQRKEDDGGHDDRAMAEAIGQLAHEQ
ncbi:hypothetical protein D3C85_1576860 [compost metagenome]